jgi:hypothetical protein
MDNSHQIVTAGCQSNFLKDKKNQLLLPVNKFIKGKNVTKAKISKKKLPTISKEKALYIGGSTLFIIVNRNLIGWGQTNICPPLLFVCPANLLFP